MIAESVNFSFLSMQAVALPEAKEVTEDPGKLPQPDKVTKAYFEVSLLPTPPHHCASLSTAKLHHQKGDLESTYELALLLLLLVLFLSLMLVLRSCAVALPLSRAWHVVCCCERHRREHHYAVMCK